MAVISSRTWTGCLSTSLEAKPVSDKKSRGELIRFHRDRGVGKVTKVHDSVGDIEDSGHDTRMQQLQHAGLGQEPFRAFATRFTGVSGDQLPSTEIGIRETRYR